MPNLEQLIKWGYKISYNQAQVLDQAKDGMSVFISYCGKVISAGLNQLRERQFPCVMFLYVPK